MSILRKVWMLLPLVLLAGCNTDPSTSITQPMTARPVPPPANAARDGSIYRVVDARPLFEDRRARFVGDTLTVNIVESSNASKSVNESTARTGAANATIGTPTVLGQTAKSLTGGLIGGNLNTSVTANGSETFGNKESNVNKNTVTGTITATVIEVLPNGNLVVSGEKQLAINQNTEFVRISGVVNPINISSANTVNSTQLADAHVESKSKQSMDTAQLVSILSRFFITLVPF